MTVIALKYIASKYEKNDMYLVESYNLIERIRHFELLTKFFVGMPHVLSIMLIVH